jgi:hypothetical protein
VESLAVNREKEREGKFFAFVKFFRNESAEKALKSDRLFNNERLSINWVISFNDNSIETNLFTKNLKPSVTED